MPGAVEAETRGPALMPCQRAVESANISDLVGCAKPICQSGKLRFATRLSKS